MGANSWKLPPGLNNVGSYQVSGRPFASGSCVAHASGTAMVIRFPSVTKWVSVEPQAGIPMARSLRVGFSENGIHGKGAATPLGGYNFNLHASSSLRGPLDMKISELWFMSNDGSTYTFDVVAGLTNVPSARTTTIDRTIDGVTEAAGPNWSGSIGVG